MPRARRVADRFDEAAASCSSLGELADLLLGTARELGFSHVALLHHASLTRKVPGLVRIDNYPSEWAAELVGSGLVAFDPVHLACRRSGGVFRWGELGALIPLERRQSLILERARGHGLSDGLTVPVTVPGEPCGSCSFAVRSGEELSDRDLAGAEVIGLHAFAAARRLAGLPRKPARPHLSRREIQCLKLAAAGKSDWEIAAILGIRPETARQYMKSARAAYDVVSRTQLVVLGLRDDWLSFEEATGAQPLLGVDDSPGS